MTRKKVSRWEEELWLWLEAEQPGEWIREWAFHPKRRFRFDFAHVEQRVAIEIDGIVWDGKGRHQTGRGIHGDCVKCAEAMCLGWKVLRIVPQMLRDGDAYEYIRKLTRTG